MEAVERHKRRAAAVNPDYQNDRILASLLHAERGRVQRDHHHGHLSVDQHVKRFESRAATEQDNDKEWQAAERCHDEMKVDCEGTRKVILDQHVKRFESRAATEQDNDKEWQGVERYHNEITLECEGTTKVILSAVIKTMMSFGSKEWQELIDTDRMVTALFEEALEEQEQLLVAEESGRNEDISAPFALMFLAFFSLLGSRNFSPARVMWGGVNPCSPPILPSSRVISQEVAPSREEDSIEEVIEEARQNALHVARQRATKLEALVAREQERCAAESTARIIAEARAENAETDAALLREKILHLQTAHKQALALSSGVLAAPEIQCTNASASKGRQKQHQTYDSSIGSSLHVNFPDEQREVLFEEWPALSKRLAELKSSLSDLKKTIGPNSNIGDKDIDDHDAVEYLKEITEDSVDISMEDSPTPTKLLKVSPQNRGASHSGHNLRNLSAQFETRVEIFREELDALTTGKGFDNDEEEPIPIEAARPFPPPQINNSMPVTCSTSDNAGRVSLAPINTTLKLKPPPPPPPPPLFRADGAFSSPLHRNERATENANNENAVGTTS